MSRTAPTLHTERLRLRAFSPEDFADCAALWADPETVRYISGVPSTDEQSWARLLRYIGHWAALGYGYWAVEALSDGRYLGEVGFADFRRALEPPLDGAPEAGWVLRPEEAGQGLATEAMRAALAWADAHIEAPRTVAMFDPAHAASLGVARKLGYGAATEALYQGAPARLLWRARPLRAAPATPV